MLVVVAAIVFVVVAVLVAGVVNSAAYALWFKCDIEK